MLRFFNWKRWRTQTDTSETPVSEPSVHYEPVHDEGPASIVADALVLLDCVEHAECFDQAWSGFFSLDDGREFTFSLHQSAFD
jgi:hypothetical protein